MTDTLVPFLVGLLGALPMMGVTILWDRRPRIRTRALVEAAVAIAAGITVASLASIPVEEASWNLPMTLPVLIAGVIMALSLNRIPAER